jgi:protein phosphatase-4 regulatory subunit 3
MMFLEKFDGLGIQVKSEEDGNILLESKVYVDDIYQRQQETLIVWNDPITNQDLALSFQEEVGCQEMWEQIQGYQARVADSAFGGDEFGNGRGVEETYHFADAAQLAPDLPPADLEGLPKLLQLVADVNTLSRKDSILSVMQRDGYLKKLLSLFHQAEETRNLGALHNLFQIIKCLVLLNVPAFIEYLMGEELALDVFAILEYDPELPPGTLRHREYLTKKGLFREIIPFNNEAVLKRIHQSFRFTYLKDVALPRHLDDSTFGTISTLIYYCNVEIVSALQNDTRFMELLFRRLKSRETLPEDRKMLVLFIQELCGLAKGFQPSNKTSFYKSLIHHGMYDIFASTLSDADVSVRSAGTEILYGSAANDPSSLRNYILMQAPTYLLLHTVVRQFVGDEEVGVKTQLMEIIRMLLDAEANEDSAKTAQRDEMLNIFYSHFMHEIIGPLTQAEPPKGVEKESWGNTKHQICDFLAFCLQHHTYRIKSFILGNNIISKVLRLLKEKESYLVLSGVRLFRAFIGQKDDYYYRHIIKYHLFDGLVEVFSKNGPRYNLLQSAIVELFEFIMKESLWLLIEYLAERFASAFQAIDYVDTFRKLLLKSEQHKEYQRDSQKASTSAAASPAKDEAMSNPSTPRRRILEDDEDERYLNEDEDELSSSSSASSSSGPIEAPISGIEALSPTRSNTLPARQNGSDEKTTLRKRSSEALAEGFGSSSSTEDSARKVERPESSPKKSRWSDQLDTERCASLSSATSNSNKRKEGKENEETASTPPASPSSPSSPTPPSSPSSPTSPASSSSTSSTSSSVSPSPADRKTTAPGTESPPPSLATPPLPEAQAANS